MAAQGVSRVEGMTIGNVLRNTARQYPHQDAVVFPRLNAEQQPLDSAPDPQNCLRWSFQKFDEEVDSAARALIGLGIGKGQHVAVWATNWPRWVVLQIATARIGAVQVTVNPAYRSSELAYVLKQSEATALFLVDAFRKSDYFAILQDAVPGLSESTPGQIGLEEFPHLKHVVAMKGEPCPGLWSWEAFLAHGDDVSAEQLAAREAELTPDDPINIQYTSGTTGFPKGAMLTHRNLLLNAFYIGDCQNITSDDRICVPVPFYHCFGCVLGVLCCVQSGAALIAPNEYFDPAATLDAIESERATAIYGVPTMFIAELEHPTFAGRDLSSLRTGIMAGSPCPIRIMRQVVDQMGATDITIAYGLTEASPVITQTRTDDPLELRVSTVGRPIPDIEVKIVDPGTGETLGDDQQGELCTRGHVVMLGYYNMPEQTAATIDEDGWLHSGDLAVRRPDGYYRITGRMKDMICRGGENIYPREIEEFLYTHPDIEDVAVFGVPDPNYVENVAAWIKLKDGRQLTEDELREFCRGKMAHFKIPAHVKFVETFPQTVTGKIQKFRMRELTIEELGLEASETA